MAFYYLSHPPFIGLKYAVPSDGSYLVDQYSDVATPPITAGEPVGFVAERAAGIPEIKK